MSLNATPNCTKGNCLKYGKYLVQEVLGQGCFGLVAKAQNEFTNQIVALKVMKEDVNLAYYQHEIKIWEYMSELDPDIFNIVNFIEHFECDGHQCMAFEMLDTSLDNLLKHEYCLSLSEIRPIAKQLLTALFGLKSIGVAHTDIKPDNMMLVNHSEQPFKVKLIDFGLARQVKKIKTGTLMQAIVFRAMEVYLGLPLSEAVDIWGVACCLLEWYTGGYRVNSESEYDFIKMIVDLLGLPSDKLLNKGLYTEKFFVEEDDKWRLKTLKEFVDSTGIYPKMDRGRVPVTLEELIKVPLESETELEVSDKEAFYDLLKKMFEMDPNERISPSEALLHPFITMEHLSKGNSYTNVAHAYMVVAERDSEELQTEGLEYAAEVAKMKRDCGRIYTKRVQESSQSESSFYTSDSSSSSTDSRNTSSEEYTSNPLSQFSSNQDSQQSSYCARGERNPKCQDKSPSELSYHSPDNSRGLPNMEDEVDNIFVNEVSEDVEMFKVHYCSQAAVHNSNELSQSSSNQDSQQNSFCAKGRFPSQPSGYVHVSSANLRHKDKSSSEISNHSRDNLRGLQDMEDGRGEVDNIIVNEISEDDCNLEMFKVHYSSLAAKEAQQMDSLEILEEDIELETDEERETASESAFARIRRFLARLKWPKKSFFRKPKWVKRFPIFNTTVTSIEVTE